MLVTNASQFYNNVSGLGSGSKNLGTGIQMEPKNSLLHYLMPKQWDGGGFVPKHDPPPPPIRPSLLHQKGGSRTSHPRQLLDRYYHPPPPPLFPLEFYLHGSTNSPSLSVERHIRYLNNWMRNFSPTSTILCPSGKVPIDCCIYPMSSPI